MTRALKRESDEVWASPRMEIRFLGATLRDAGAASCCVYCIPQRDTNAAEGDLPLIACNTSLTL